MRRFHFVTAATRLHRAEEPQEIELHYGQLLSLPHHSGSVTRGGAMAPAGCITLLFVFLALSLLCTAFAQIIAKEYSVRNSFVIRGGTVDTASSLDLSDKGATASFTLDFPYVCSQPVYNFQPQMLISPSLYTFRQTAVRSLLPAQDIQYCLAVVSALMAHLLISRIAYAPQSDVSMRGQSP